MTSQTIYLLIGALVTICLHILVRNYYLGKNESRDEEQRTKDLIDAYAIEKIKILMPGLEEERKKNWASQKGEMENKVKFLFVFEEANLFARIITGQLRLKRPTSISNGPLSTQDLPGSDDKVTIGRKERKTMSRVE